MLIISIKLLNNNSYAHIKTGPFHPWKDSVLPWVYNLQTLWPTPSHLILKYRHLSCFQRNMVKIGKDILAFRVIVLVLMLALSTRPQ